MFSEEIKDRIPKQVFKGIDMCRINGINITVGNEITMPNCTNFSWTIDNITSKDIRLALIKVNLISHDLGYLQDKFGFSDEDMQSVPQAPFEYLRETFKATAFRASQFKMLHKLIYTKKLLHICRLVDTNLCEGCTNEIKDFKHMLWSC